MVIGIIGESCTGKSTIADQIKNRTEATVYSGKDYLKMAKSESEATQKFVDLLKEAERTEETVIYVITEKEHVALLPAKAYKVLVTAELEVIKERFAARMHGNLPAPLAQMLERKHGMFDDGQYDMRVTNSTGSAEELASQILEAI